MLSVEDARARIVAAAPALPAEQVPLTEALGRVLAEDVAARRTQPPMAVSAMDGYAVRAADVADVPVTLDIVGYAPAGAAYDGTVGPGQTVRIFTGAPVPDGADAIVIQEDTEPDGKERVRVLEGAREGRYVRPAGLDFAEGTVLLKAGLRLTARDVGLAAAMNRPWLMVRRRPRVAILSTGDEVVMPGDPVGLNQIVSSNSLALHAAVREYGGEPVLLGISPDDTETLIRMAGAAAGCDLLLTTGGVSVGDHDLIQSALGGTGLEVDFWRIAMRPGKPLMFGKLGETLVMGLPGNPVSTLVCALVYLRPLMSAMLGIAETGRTTVGARLAAPLPENDQRQDYLRATAVRDTDGILRVTAFDKQDSSMMVPLSRADCLIIRAPFAPAAGTGEAVEILPLHDRYTHV